MAVRKQKNEDAVRIQVSDLRNLDIAELRNKLAKEQDDLMRARFKHTTAALEKTSELKDMRRQIARIYTVLNEKERRA